MFQAFRLITFLIFSRFFYSCVKAQQHSNFLYTIAPTQYRAYGENPYWRYYNVPLAAAAAKTQPPPQQHLPSTVLPTPMRFQPYYGSQYPSTPSQLSHQTHQLIELRRAAPEIVQQQRNEGNFYRHVSSNATAQRKFASEVTPKPKSAGFAVFEHKILHVTTPITPAEVKDYRRRRSFSTKNHAQNPKFQTNDSLNNRSLNNRSLNNRKNDLTLKDSGALQQDETTAKFLNIPSNEMQQKKRYFHDIFMHYAGPQSVAYGHVERQPERFGQRFESLSKGNRYRGEVTWADAKTGGYGSQHWDLAQGKL